MSMYRKFRFVWLFVSSFALFSALEALADGHAEALQKKGIERIERYIDHFRRTFDQESLRQELTIAEVELQQSAELFGRSGAANDLALTLLKLGDIRRMTDQWDSAIATYEKALDAARHAKDLGVECKTLIALARTYLIGTKNSGQALEVIREAIPTCEQSENPESIFSGWDMLTQVQVSGGDYVGAADSINKAFGVKSSISDDKLLFYGYLDRADVYQHFAEKCDYERDFKFCLENVELARRDYQAALQTAQKLNWQGLAQQTQQFLKRLDVRKQLIESQQRMHALMSKTDLFSPNSIDDVVISRRFTSGQNPHLSGLLSWLEKNGGMPDKNDARGSYIKGLFSEMEGNSEAALTWYLRATDLLDQDRGLLYDERSRSAFVEDRVEFYYTAVLNLLEQERVHDAFNLMERARSRVMSDLLNTKKLTFSSAKEQAMYAEMIELRSLIAQRQNCLFTIRNGTEISSDCRLLGQLNQTVANDRRGVTVSDDPGAAIKIDPAPIENDLNQMQAQFQQLYRRIADEAPNLDRLLTSKAAELADIQKILATDDSEMIAYLALETQVLIWHINSGSIRVRSVFLPRSTLKEKIERVRNSLTDPKRPFDDKTANELYLFLIAPIAEWIGSERIVIVPHEDLNYLPFQALPAKRGEHYFGEHYQLSYLPNATLLANLESVKGLGQAELFAVADPSLRYAPDEVKAIAQYFNGRFWADRLPTETELKGALSGNGLIHLAVHGSFETNEPLLSYLHLQASQQDDGKLTAAEMYGLPLDAAKLVVLSACETGSVKASHANEVVGMMRGLIFAGADSLLLSAWKIDDKATAEWMKVFYRNAVDQSPAAAAQAAIKALRAKPEYRHPYYWSPFLLIGR